MKLWRTCTSAVSAAMIGGLLAAPAAAQPAPFPSCVSPVLASTVVQETDNDVTCEWRELENEPSLAIILISSWCPACGEGKDICTGEANCRRASSDYSVRMNVFCPAVLGDACPDATTCFYSSDLRVRRGPTRVVDMRQDEP